MDSPTGFRLAADALLLLHALFVAFVVLTVPLVLAGRWRRWAWVRNPWLRLAHLLAIAVVVAQAWFGVVCPLTTWEMALRARAGEAVYAGAFMAHWLGVLLYYRAPAWVFTAVYTVFALLVAATWLWVPPRPLRGRAIANEKENANGR
ncbi:DUF2784 domain-containing protein [Parahaliea mediterranea]|uniref:DUF2784 domain-containing protein n=1 Tax=Parahaliea mediterranea TaxID=651086 RepID=A0A939DCL9_9GAMM|nr:DUF2784 domain-containing protein [Parahaliea mediterranea]MBN7795748.1 DUF2784 domain-containing protein [Parahaliea mediterranea]